MTTYIIRRCIQAIIVLVVVSLVVFLAMRLLPGDPILMLMSADQFSQSTAEEIASLRQEYGLDKPLMVQYFNWITGVMVGDFGQSIVYNEPVMKEIGRRLPITLHLSLLGMFFSIVIGITAGVICAVRRATWLDTIVTVFANIGITIPIFWLGIMMVYLVGYKLDWLPIHGYTSPLEDFWLNTKQVIMPVFCLAIFPMASFVRQTRSSMLEIMHQDYIRTAWAKGLRERSVVLKHSLKNSMIPVVTLVGMGFGQVIGGSVLIETVFNIPGMGRMAVSAVMSHDYPVVQGFVLVVALVIVFSNLIVDLSYGWLDPRIRYS